MYFVLMKWFPEPYYAVNSVVSRKFKPELLTQTIVSKTNALTLYVNNQDFVPHTICD